MTHRIVVNLETGETTQVEYTSEEQTAYDAAVAAQAELPVETPVEVPVTETPAEAEVTPTEGV